jgi:hypothetical protein
MSDIRNFFDRLYDEIAQGWIAMVEIWLRDMTDE